MVSVAASAARNGGNRMTQGGTQGKGAGKQVSRHSLRGLDALNFLMADVQGGLGPYLTVFLASERWQPGSIGLAMAAGSISAAICQIPAGLLVDATRAKRLVAAASGLMIAAACLVIAWFPHFFPVLGAVCGWRRWCRW